MMPRLNSSMGSTGRHCPFIIVDASAPIINHLDGSFITRPHLPPLTIRQMIIVNKNTPRVKCIQLSNRDLIRCIQSTSTNHTTAPPNINKQTTEYIKTHPRFCYVFKSLFAVLFVVLREFLLYKSQRQFVIT
jgi:hypothetical protein